MLTARMEVTDRMLIFGQGHLRTILAHYEAHYNGRRPHRRQLHPPRPDHFPVDLSRERIQRRPVLGGLKVRPGGHIGVHASISVAQALLAAGVADELRLVIAPKIAGSGRRLLDGLPPIQLESIRSATSPSGHLLVDYRVIR